MNGEKFDINELPTYPWVLDGDIVPDDRGHVSFCNLFDMTKIKRFYIVENHNNGYIRAWHGHKEEAKYVLVLEGSFMFNTLPIESLEKKEAATPQKFVLSARKPQILYIPPGFANGFMSLQDDSKVMFFSDSTIEESLSDDYRFSILDDNTPDDTWWVLSR